MRGYILYPLMFNLCTMLVIVFFLYIITIKVRSFPVLAVPVLS
jgi:hypothetical protein